jgi:hypothetical protein
MFLNKFLVIQILGEKPDPDLSKSLDPDPDSVNLDPQHTDTMTSELINTT